tara:strand:+ start:1122 stop:2942 length:1821 start_codon:yes stop_codon:yes gene_type:complete
MKNLLTLNELRQLITNEMEDQLFQEQINLFEQLLSESKFTAAIAALKTAIGGVKSSATNITTALTKLKVLDGAVKKLDDIKIDDALKDISTSDVARLRGLTTELDAVIKTFNDAAEAATKAGQNTLAKQYRAAAAAANRSKTKVQNAAANLNKRRVKAPVRGGKPTKATKQQLKQKLKDKLNRAKNTEDGAKASKKAIDDAAKAGVDAKTVKNLTRTKVAALIAAGVVTVGGVGTAIYFGLKKGKATPKGGGKGGGSKGQKRSGFSNSQLRIKGRQQRFQTSRKRTYGVNVETGEDLTLENVEKAVVKDIKHLQRTLVALGYDLGDFGPDKNGVDGQYGDLTAGAILEIQKVSPGITADGVWGKGTSEALAELALEKQNEEPIARWAMSVYYRAIKITEGGQVPQQGWDKPPQSKEDKDNEDIENLLDGLLEDKRYSLITGLYRTTRIRLAMAAYKAMPDLGRTEELKAKMRRNSFRLISFELPRRVSRGRRGGFTSREDMGSKFIITRGMITDLKDVLKSGFRDPRTKKMVPLEKVREVFREVFARYTKEGENYNFNSDLEQARLKGDARDVIDPVNENSSSRIELVNESKSYNINFQKWHKLWK